MSHDPYPTLIRTEDLTGRALNYAVALWADYNPERLFPDPNDDTNLLLRLADGTFAPSGTLDYIKGQGLQALGGVRRLTSCARLGRYTPYYDWCVANGVPPVTAALRVYLLRHRWEVTRIPAWVLDPKIPKGFEVNGESVEVLPSPTKEPVPVAWYRWGEGPTPGTKIKIFEANEALVRSTPYMWIALYEKESV